MVILTVTFYHDGLFIGPPLEYTEGNKDIMQDLDFESMMYGKLFDFIGCSTEYPPVGIFYCLPGSDLSDGIRELKNEQQFGDFIAVALGNGGKIDVYVEHHGYDIHDWFAKDDADLEDSDEDGCELDDISAFVEPQYVREEEVIIPNRCTSDPFLNRLWKTDPNKTTRNTFGTSEGDTRALVEDEIEDQSVDPIYKVKPGVVYPEFNPNQPWNEMAPILGMRFKDHEEIKIMLANYGVANGYQLWYKRNDYKSLLVLCGRNVEEGGCASKVGRKVKETATKGKGKETAPKGNGKETAPKGKGKEIVAEGKKKWTRNEIAEGNKNLQMMILCSWKKNLQMMILCPWMCPWKHLHKWKRNNMHKWNNLHKNLF